MVIVAVIREPAVTGVCVYEDLYTRHCRCRGNAEDMWRLMRYRERCAAPM